jgi:hypothetical protein
MPIGPMVDMSLVTSTDKDCANPGPAWRHRRMYWSGYVDSRQLKEYYMRRKRQVIDSGYTGGYVIL